MGGGVSCKHLRANLQSFLFETSSNACQVIAPACSRFLLLRVRKVKRGIDRVVHERLWDDGEECQRTASCAGNCHGVRQNSLRQCRAVERDENLLLHWLLTFWERTVAFHKYVNRAALARLSRSSPALPAHCSGDRLRCNGVPRTNNHAGVLRFQVRVELNGNVVAKRV